MDSASKVWKRRYLAAAVVLPFLFGATCSHEPQTGPVVAVVDLGIDPGGLLRPVIRSIDVSEASQPATAETFGHGTTLANVVAEGCPSCRFVSVRVGAALAEVRLSKVAEGIDEAVRAGAEVVLVGLASPSSNPALDRALTNAEQRGVVVVAPAGNGEYTQSFFPAADPRVVGVTALEDTVQLAMLSNTSGAETVAARGVDVSVPGPGGQPARVTGTSVAAALTAAAVGRLLAAEPSLTPAAVRTVLSEMVRRLCAFSSRLVRTVAWAGPKVRAACSPREPIRTSVVQV